MALRSKTLILIGTAGLLALTGTLTGCSSKAAAGPLSEAAGTGANNHPDWSQYTFTIGDNGGDGSQDLAKITGVFDNAPYKVKFARFTYGPPLVQAAASGDIDLGSVGDVPPITGAAQEYGFKIVAVQRSLTPTQPDENIIVPKGSSIQTLAQLKGRKIAVPQGSSAHGLVLNALKSVGLTTKDVQLDFLSPAAGATAFATGKVDAWAIWNPQSAIAISNGARVLAKGLPPIDQTSSYYVASNASLDNPTKRAALTDLLERLSKEFAWAVKHPDQYAQAVAEEDGISQADAKISVAAQESRVTAVLPSDVTAEQRLSDAFLAAGQIGKQVDVSSIIESILPAGYDSSKTG
ncbi:MAG TPA: aliphatic sulfonate ABC transporter substrate-binding protein [Actinospica sp.]|nr:aliphatic sulfonate ABC transporter substrate-binding protein [Actinospica sp.]